MTTTQGPGRWVYAPGCRLPHWVADPPNLTITEESGALTPTNRGVKYSNIRDYVNVTSDPAVGWVSPVGSPVVRGSAVDWLTLTATDERGMQQLFQMATKLGDDLRSDGDEMKQRRELQYEGYRVGRHLFYGESSRQGGYLRVSGSVAPSALDRVREMQHRYFHATRYDAQVTAVYNESPDRDFFDGMATASEAYARHVARRGRPWSVEVRKMYGKGDTAYIGDKATAEVYGRSYDKHKEGLKTGTEYPEGAVRFEVSHRREMANMLLADAMTSDNLGEFHAGYVHGWFGARGVDLGFDAKQIQQLHAPKHQSDTEKRRKWFRTQVRKGAQLNAFAVGLEETLKDLGLWEEVCKQYLNDR